MFENGWNRLGEPDRQAVLQRGADQVFCAEARAGVHEENVVGQMSQTRAPKKGLYPR